MSNNENDYVSLVRIPRKWFNVFVGFFLTLILTNTFVEIITDWKWELLGDTILTRMAVLMTLIVGWFFIISHIWEFIMLGYARIFRDKVFAEGEAKGVVIGEAKGVVIGEAKHHRKVLEWNHRRIQAEKEGKEFTEPIPEPTQIKESNEL